MSALDTEPFPRGALIAAGALIGLTLVSTAAFRIAQTVSPPPAVVVPVPVAAADLRFGDAGDGAVKVWDSHSGALVATLAPGTNGFVRGVMRGLARDRISRHIGAAPPFRLSETRDGSLSLADPSTGRVIDLNAFGETNRAAFLALLHSDGGRA